MEVVRPRFPTPRGQSLSAWLDVYDRAVGRLAAAPTGGLAGLFLAAGFVGALGLPDYDPINHFFFAAPFEWPAIRGCARVVRCWAGDDDPYVPLARSQAMATCLKAPLDIVSAGGHLDGEAGFTSFPPIRDAILSARLG